MTKEKKHSGYGREKVFARRDDDESFVVNGARVRGTLD